MDDSFKRELSRLVPDLELSSSFQIERHNRFAQIRDSGASVNFWENGMCWHCASFENSVVGARAAWSWCYQRMNAPDLERSFPGLRFPERRRRIEEGVDAFLEWHWEEQRRSALSFLEAWDPELNPWCRLEAEAITLLCESAVIKRLMSFMQLETYGVTRYIGNYGDGFVNDLFRISSSRQSDEVLLLTEPQVLRMFTSTEWQWIMKGSVEDVCSALVERVTGLATAEYQTLEQYLQRRGVVEA